MTHLQTVPQAGNMNNTTKKAVIAQINLGALAIEGLMLPDGSFAIGVSQLEALNLVRQNQASRDVKALLGESFQFDKAKSELNPKPVNIIKLPDFEKLVSKLAQAGNKPAIDLCVLLIGLSLHQLFCDGFNVKFETNERQEWLKARLVGKQVRRTLTDAIAEYLERNNCSPSERKYMYANVSDRLNRLLFGASAKQLCENYQCGRDTLRNQFDSKEIKNIGRLEDYAMRLVDRDNIHPMNAINEAHSFWAGCNR